MNKKLYSIILVMMAYVIPMLIGFAVNNKNQQIFWGVVPMIISLAMLGMKYEIIEKTEDNTFASGVALFVVGIVFACLIGIGGFAVLGWLTVAILVIDFIFCLIF